MPWSPSDYRERAERLRNGADELEAGITDQTPQDLADWSRDQAKRNREMADDLDRQADAGGEPSPGGGGEEETPPNNPAVQIGEATAEVEAATAEVAEAVAEAGEPELAQAVEGEVAQRLDNATQEIAAAAETVEAVAEEVETHTPPDTPEGAAATEAVEAAQEAEDAVEVAEEAVREVKRVPEVQPDAEHWYFRSRFKRRKKAKA